jgi:hypothetical protein
MAIADQLTKAFNEFEESILNMPPAYRNEIEAKMKTQLNNLNQALFQPMIAILEKHKIK